VSTRDEELPLCLEEPTPAEAVFELSCHLKAIIEHDVDPVSAGTMAEGLGDEELAHYANVIREAASVLQRAAVKLERAIMDRMEAEGLSLTGSVTRRRMGDYVAEYRKVTPAPDPCPDFAVLVGQLQALAAEKGVEEEYRKCVSFEPKVNRTYLKGLAAAGGEISQLCARLFVPKDWYPKVVLVRSPAVYKEKP
jgi:hypothetical protein